MGIGSPGAGHPSGLLVPSILAVHLVRVRHRTTPFRSWPALPIHTCFRPPILSPIAPREWDENADERGHFANSHGKSQWVHVDVLVHVWIDYELCIIQIMGHESCSGLRPLDLRFKVIVRLYFSDGYVFSRRTINRELTY